MKKLSVLLTLLLLLGCLTGCSGAAKAEPLDEQAVSARILLDDFTVQTADGGSFTLSKALEGKKLALIYLFSTNLGACVTEMPNLEQAYAAYGDRVAVVGLSVSPDDDAALLSEYAAYLGLSFPLGNDSTVGLAEMASGYPAMLVLDAERHVLAAQSEDIVSAEALTQLLDYYLSGDFRLDRCRHQVVFYDAGNMDRIAGCTASFTLDGESQTVTSGEDGLAVFTGRPASYHVLAESAPEGYHIIAYGEYDTPVYDSIHYVALEPLP